MTNIDYQEKILNYYKDKIRNCSGCKAGGVCWKAKELADTSRDYYKQGPELAFVGERYGKPGYPKILFTRLNPIKVKKIKPIFFFGSRESLKKYGGDGAKEIFRLYLEGWKDNNREYRGLRDAGTVTGHSNQSNLPDKGKLKPPHYGIQIIMNKMIEAEVFDEPKNSPLEFCAINNVIKCAGNGENSKPRRNMRNNCNYYQQELDKLKPDIIIAFGGKTDSYIKNKKRNFLFLDKNRNELKLKNGKNDKICKYFEFPHPLHDGKKWWKGKGINERFFQPSPTYPHPEKDDKNLFESGADGKYPMALYNYIMYVVNVAVEIKKRLKADHNF
jgi:hypothetical protein